MPSTQADLTPTKLALRRTVRAQRQSRSPSEAAAAEAAIALIALELPAVRRAGCVALYASLTSEPGTTRLRAALRERGTTVLLPVIENDTLLSWAVDNGEVSPAGALGVPEPVSRPEAELRSAEVILVPALAVDTAGTRLGRGRGYYDRALAAAAPSALIMALVHDDEVLDAHHTPIPCEEHDVVVHGVLTPTRWMFFTPPPE